MGALLAAALGLCARASASPSYDVFPTAVEGSTRYVGLGGAIVTQPQDYGASFVNPAALGGQAGTGIDFGSDSNGIDNFVVENGDVSSRSLNEPLKYSYFGVRYVTENGWGFGLTKQTPFQLDDVFSGSVVKTKKGGNAFQQNADQTEIKVVNNTYTLAAARSYWDQRLSLGLAVNLTQLSESYDFMPVKTTTAPIHRDATGEALSADFGLLAQPKPWLLAAVVYKMGYRAPFDGTRNGDLRPGVTAFRDGKSPDRVTAGLAWRPNRKLSVYAQSTYVLKMRDTVVTASGVFPGGANVVAAGQYATLDGHWGAEFIPIDEPDFTFKLWAGGYLENTGVQGGYSRYHRTAGFGFSPWFLSLSMAVDDAELYNNFAVGFGVDLLAVADRVSKTFGWKLPL